MNSDDAKPRIALFRADDAEFHQHAALFARMAVELRVLSDSEDIAAVMNTASEALDCVILPLRLRGGTSAVSAALTLKSDPVFSVVPLIVLSPNRDRGVLESLYGAGADVVMVAPFDPDYIYFQIEALARQKRCIDEKVGKHESDLSLGGVGISALDSVPEGVVIVCEVAADKMSVAFMNEAARALFDVAADARPEDLQRVLAFLEPLINHRDNGPHETSLSRLDGQIIDAIVIRSALRSSRGTAQGWALSIRDSADRKQLSHMLAQGLRTRSLCLLAMAGSIALLRRADSQNSDPALTRVQSLLKLEKPAASLNAVALHVLETLDLVLSPGVELRVDLRAENDIAMTEGDLFQLLGHMTLHAIEAAGAGGETLIGVEAIDFAKSAMLVVSSKINRFAGALRDPVISPLITNTVFDVNQGGERLSFGLEAAHDIAQRYGSEIEYKQTATTVKVRCALPLLGS